MNISNKLISILSCIKPSKAIREVATEVSKPAEEAAKETKELLPKAQYCYKYWASALDEGLVRQGHKESVDLHGQLHGINHHFILSAYPKHLDQKIFVLGEELTPREMIFRADMDFKRLKPTTESMKVFRCVGEKPDFFAEYPQYEKRLKVKKGEIINMREYAYATSDIGYANVYLPNGRGITYEIEIPKGARVSRTGDIGKTDEVVFPRSSRFECLDTQHIQDGDSDYTLIKLRYILPDEPWRKAGHPTLD